MLKWIGRGLLALVAVVLVLGLVNRDRLERLWRVNTLFDEERIVANFTDMRGMFFAADMVLGDAPVTPLPEAPVGLPKTFSYGGETFVVADWLEANAAAALVVLKDGAIAHEAYFSGSAEDLRISWSVAKSFLSVLLGTVVERGEITSLDDPVTQYAPELVGSAYEGATVRDVAHMASGVAFNEDYFDFDSDINRMGRVLALGGSMDEFAAALEVRDRPPGQFWQYVSIDTHVLSMVIRGATGRSVVELMAERVMTPLGLEADPYYLTDGFGTAFVLGGLNLRTRDYARFGLMVMDGGVIDGRHIVSNDWILDSTRATAPSIAPDYFPDFDPATGYGLQWWVPPNPEPGEVYGIGVYDQFIYVNPGRGVVVALNSANRDFADDGVQDRQIAFFRAIAAHLSP